MVRLVNKIRSGLCSLVEINSDIGIDDYNNVD